MNAILISEFIFVVLFTYFYHAYFAGLYGIVSLFWPTGKATRESFSVRGCFMQTHFELTFYSGTTTSKMF